MAESRGGSYPFININIQTVLRGYGNIFLPTSLPYLTIYMPPKVRNLETKHCTLSAWLTLVPASMSVFTMSWCPLTLAMSSGLQWSCNTNVIITRGWTSGGECWNITYDRCTNTWLHYYHHLVSRTTLHWNTHMHEAHTRTWCHTQFKHEAYSRKHSHSDTTIPWSRAAWTLQHNLWCPCVMTYN